MGNPLSFSGRALADVQRRAIAAEVFTPHPERAAELATTTAFAWLADLLDQLASDIEATARARNTDRFARNWHRGRADSATTLASALRRFDTNPDALAHLITNEGDTPR